MVSTWDEQLGLEGQVERWIRLGTVAEDRVIDRRTGSVSFRPGAIFGLVRWRAGEHAAVDSKVAGLRAMATGKAFTTQPFAPCGEEILLRMSGRRRIRAALEAIDAIERAGFAPEAVSPDHWQTVGARIGVGLPPKPYDRARHRARRMRKWGGL